MALVARLRWQWATADRLLIALAAVVVVLAAASNDEPSGMSDSRALDALAVCLVALGGSLVAFGGRFPAAAAALVMALTYLWYGIGYESGVVNVVTLGVFYRVGRADNGAKAKLAIVSLVVVVTLVMMAGVGNESWWDAFTAAGYVVMAVLLGELIRSRHLLVEHYATEAERAQRDADRRIAEERLRIAWDVHDLLSHTVSSMTVQAGVAADSIDRDDQVVRDALDNMRRAGREAMQEVRATVAVLRSGVGPASTAPAPGVDRLADLVEATREQGIEVSLTVELPDRPLPVLSELTVYRIVQESLTNVVRHSGASNVVVSVRLGGSALCVEVHDDGSSDSHGEPGFGLRGMSERVTSIGGELWHGVGPDGGWTVRARLPVPSEAS